MEYEVLVQKDITEVKSILSLQIQQAYKLKETLDNRCSKLKEMLDIYESNIIVIFIAFIKITNYSKSKIVTFL